VISCKSHVKKWGNSFGVLLPKEAVVGEKLKEDEEVVVIITKKINPLKEMFGALSFGKQTRKLLRDVDSELDVN